MSQVTGPRTAARKLRPSRLTVEEVAARFPPQQVRLWTPGWRPLVATAAFIRPDGIALRDIIASRQDLRDPGAPLMRELLFETREISSLRVRSLLESSMRSEKHRRLIKKVLARDRCPSLEDVAEFFQIRAAVPTAATYDHLPYAFLQELALKPIEQCTSLDSKVFLPTFGALNNLLNIDYDSLTAMKALHNACGDTLVYTSEFVTELALYLRRRLTDLHPDPVKRPMRPIVVYFEPSGRLAHLLNETGLIPVRVVSIVHRDQLTPRWDRTVDLPATIPAAFRATFHTFMSDVAESLTKHEPSMAIVGPHHDRDYLCDIRGFFSMREVLCIGQVDSPAMGSHNFPWLTFGCSQGPDTFYVYTDKLRKLNPAPRSLADAKQLADRRLKQERDGQSAKGVHPMDPPHVSQGYERAWVDEISRFVVHPNDTYHLPRQARCLAFRRIADPQRPSPRHCSPSIPQEVTEELE